ncbi:MAG: hypothetical protein H0U25_09565 [Thermoleophilaceae bacterium]|nr:hypothetical protein [Thermoleophilaceae bacterium]
MLHLTAPALLLVALALFTAGPAMASPDDVVRDCADDGFVEIGRHSRSDLQQARNRIPADLDAYSDCKAQINEALDNPRAGVALNKDGFPGGDGSGGGGSGGDGSGGDGSGSGSGSGGSAGQDEPSAEEEQRAAAAVERKRQLARKDTESLLGERNVKPGTAGALAPADTANGISLPLLLAIIALVLGLAAGVVVALGRRNPELFAGTLGRLPFLRGRDFPPPVRRR